MKPTRSAADIAAEVERFVRDEVVPYEKDARLSNHGPSDEMVAELRTKARSAGLITPHFASDGTHLNQRETAMVFKKAGLSPLGPVALNIAAPDEGNMYLLAKIASADQKRQFLLPLVAGDTRSAFMMTEPALEGGAGSDPSMMQTTAMRQGDHWIINGRKTLITGAVGAKIGILMAKSQTGPCMFIFEMPCPGIRVERVLDTIDNSLPGGHAEIAIENLTLKHHQALGEIGQGFQYAQIRLAPARLSHCMRWYGACVRANEIATNYACRRSAFGRPLVDHEGIGFMLADNLIDLQQSELMIDWCADVLDSGAAANLESSMTKVAVSEALFRIADRCVQVLGGLGVTRDTIVEQVFREIRAFRIYDGPTEVHKWSIAKSIKREHRVSTEATVKAQER